MTATLARPVEIQASAPPPVTPAPCPEWCEVAAHRDPVHRDTRLPLPLSADYPAGGEESDRSCRAVTGTVANGEHGAEFTVALERLESFDTTGAHQLWPAGVELDHHCLTPDQAHQLGMLLLTAAAKAGHR